MRLERNNINKVSIKTEQIRAGYSHIKEVSFRVYLDSSLVTWVTVEDFTCVVAAFLSLNCLLRIQPGSALFFSFTSFTVLALIFILASDLCFLKGLLFCIV